MRKHFKDIDQVLGEPMLVEIEGEERKMAPLGPYAHSMTRQHLKNNALAAYDNYLRSLDEEDMPPPNERYEQRAYIIQREIDDHQLNQFWSTIDGLLFLIYASLSAYDEEITFQDVKNMALGPERIEEITDSLAASSPYASRNKGDEDGEQDHQQPTPDGNKTSQD